MRITSAARTSGLYFCMYVRTYLRNNLVIAMCDTYYVPYVLFVFDKYRIMYVDAETRDNNQLHTLVLLNLNSDAYIVTRMEQ